MKRCYTTKSDFYRTENTVSNRSKVSKPPTPDRHTHKSKERQTSHSNQHLLKTGAANKQQNISPDITSSLNTVRHSPLDDSAVEGTVKRANPPKQRSRSTVSDRQPWGQLLNKHTNAESESVFGKFDPLRTLHFLARELQMHMQTRLPDETNLQEIIKAMHSALKRIPPEVASTVQLQQQSIELLPKVKKSISKDCLEEEKLDGDKAVQTRQESHSKELGDFQKLIEGSTMKLEASCRHLEEICGQLRDEKLSLENMLQSERNNSKLLQSRIEQMESANNQLSYTVAKKNEELVQLKSNLTIVESKLQEKQSSKTEVQATLGDLKKSKLHLEQHASKLEHQLRLCAIEKEKYLAILAVRDRQIYEIRNEMTQLQHSVNEQLLELHNYAVTSVPSTAAVIIVQAQDKAGKEADTISSIWANEDQSDNKSDHSLQDLDFDDDEKQQRPTHDVFQGVL